jgi:hypothetical protein
VYLVLLKGLALRKQQRDNAVGVIVGTKNLRMMSRDTMTI